MVCGSAGSGLPASWCDRWSSSGPLWIVGGAGVEQLVLAEMLADPEPLLAEQRLRLLEQRDD